MPTERRLTEVQRCVLAKIGADPWSHLSPPFQTSEALRRRGLVCRYTLLCSGADWADKDGIHAQYRNRTPKPIHYWEITNAGRRALEVER